MESNEKRVNSMKITMNGEGVTYELDFNRDAVEFAERREFLVEDVFKFPQTKGPELFYYAFRMHHKNLAKANTDEILRKIGGLTPKMIDRLTTLFNQAQMSNNIQDDEDLEKNGAVTVEF